MMTALFLTLLFIPALAVVYGLFMLWDAASYLAFRVWLWIYFPPLPYSKYDEPIARYSAHSKEFDE